jgi:hypothetical protein
MHVTVTFNDGHKRHSHIISNMMPNRAPKQFISPQKLQLDEIMVCSRDACLGGEELFFPLSSMASGVMLSAHAFFLNHLETHISTNTSISLVRSHRLRVHLIDLALHHQGVGDTGRACQEDCRFSDLM